jgi:hypothetical protein
LLPTNTSRSSSNRLICIFRALFEALKPILKFRVSNAFRPHPLKPQNSLIQTPPPSVHPLA